MWLTDDAIAAAVRDGELSITPFVRERSRPASHLLTLADRVMRAVPAGEPIDVLSRTSVRGAFTTPESGSPILIGPGELVLAATRERIGLGPALAARLTGLSHLARLGLAVHVTADLVSPGFGWDEPTAVTLELVNHHPRALLLHEGMPICHLVVERLAAPVERSYHRLGVRYAGEQPSGSRYAEEFGVPAVDEQAGR